MDPSDGDGEVGQAPLEHAVGQPYRVESFRAESADRIVERLERLPSAVLTAMGVDAEWALGTVRLTVGRWTTHGEVRQAAAALATSYQVMRPVEVA